MRPRHAAVFSLCFVTLGWASSWAKPLWFDELFTVYIARLPAWRDFWSAATAGTYQNPPLHYFAVRFSMQVLGDGHLGARLPSIVAFMLACGAIYCFVARRCGPAPAWAAAILPMLTEARTYIVEARPHAFMFLGGALALLCWQRAAEETPRTKYLFGISLSLAFALLSHCYAVLLFVPLAAGELARTCARRRRDARIWMAIAAPAFLVLTYLPLFETTRAFGGHTLAAPTLQRLAGTYIQLADPFAWAVVGAAVIVALRSLHELFARSNVRIPVHEIVVALTLVALPVAGFLLAAGLTGFYHFRYVLPSVAGFAFLLAYLLEGRSFPDWRAWVPAMVIAAYWVGSVGESLAERIRDGPVFSSREIESCGAADPALPIAAANGFIYLPLQRGSPAPLRERLVYLLDRNLAVQHTRTDSIDLGLDLLSRIAPLHLEPFADFVVRHPRFLVYGPLRTPTGWLGPELESAGAKLTPLPGCSQDLRLVTMPARPGAATSAKE